MKKQKHFYSHLVETTSLSLTLGDMDMTQDERKHLLSLVESNLHHEIIDAILSELSDADKKLFLEELMNDDHTKIWQFLTQKVDHIEEKIQKVAEDLKKELHKDIADVSHS